MNFKISKMVYFIDLVNHNNNNNIQLERFTRIRAQNLGFSGGKINFRHVNRDEQFNSFWK